MDLKRNFKTGRAQEARKKLFLPSRFNLVSSIVKAYGLDNAFLRLLDRVDERAFHNLAKSAKIKEKPGLTLPLFSLATEAEYLLTAAIMEKLDNPYLDNARDPEELVLSAPLYRRNPALPPEVLAPRHFAELLAEELEK
ncbi:MAG: hypothetical protein FJ126_02075 [Deltaproteobacteria bacterium]|nr:hypothetical protein [Deltaproteobacteria bacterium]